MLLAVDVGNTNIVLGVHDGLAWSRSWRVASDPSKMPDEYAALLDSLLNYAGTSLRSVTAVAISCVVPALLSTFAELSRNYCSREPIVVGPNVRTGIKNLYDNPKEVGADRIANAVATFQLYGGPAIIIDFGTATTVDALSVDGEYLGGAIAPGLIVAADALFSRAARLYRVELERPKLAIGRDTGTSVQSGLIFGYVGLIEGLINRFRAEMGPAKVIATGGLADVIAGETKLVDTIDPMLTLEGLRLIYDLNRPVPASASR